ncbi:MAG: cytochrome c oxidase subunit II [Thermoleophilaceae bacterium]
MPHPTSIARGSGAFSARARLAASLALALVVAGCGEQSPLDPVSKPAREVAQLWWWMLGAATVVFAGAVFLLFLAWRQRGREGLPLVGKRKGAELGLVIGFGVVIPTSVLIVLFALANIVVLKDTEAPKASTTSLTVDVTGRQWFWKVRYPGTAAVTANEVHIPARTRVNLVGRTEDVIHSIWVPRLNRKIDTIPGKSNRVLLYADRPGRYRGQCAEFCGLQHAHMSMYVFADPPERFRAWLANMKRSRPRPATAAARLGESAFLSEQCASCHTIRGTRARGNIGPDLTHLRSRSTLAGLTIPNRRDYLARWIRDPQHFKPGNKMPALGLSGTEIAALVVYLEGLR